MFTLSTVLEVPEPHRSLVRELIAENKTYDFRMSDSPAGQKLLAMTPEEQRDLC